MKHVSRVWIALGIAFIAVVYSILLFGWKKALAPGEAISYGFTVLAFLIAVFRYLVPKKDVKEYPMIETTQDKILFAYLGIQFLVGGILFMLIPGSGERIVFIVCVLILAAFLGLTVVVSAGKSHIRAIDHEDYQNVSELRKFGVTAAAIKNSLKDQTLVTLMEQMEEIIKYSDPVSVDETIGLEDRIRNNLSILREAVESDEPEKAETRIRMIIQLLRERNDLIAAVKK